MCIRDSSQTAGAEIMYAAVLEALQAREIEFLDADDIAEFSGNDGLNCAARPECPEILWDKIKGKLALTAPVGMKGETLNVLVEFHRPGKKDAIEFVQDELPAKKAGELAMDLALITQDLLNAKLGEGPEVGAAAVADLEGGDGGDPLGDITPGVAGAATGAAAGAAAAGAAVGAPPAPGAPSVDAPSVDAPSDASSEADAASEDTATPEAPAEDPAEAPAEDPAAAPAEGAAPVTAAPAAAPAADAPVSEAPSGFDPTATARSLGVTKRQFAKYEASGLSPDAWAAEMRVRSRRFFLELHAGVTMGDVKRRYATRVALQQEGETRFRPLGYYQRDAMLTGAAFSTAASLGYTPAWWLEGGLLFGLEFPRKELITGWEAYGPDDDYADRNPGSEDQVVYQPATALTVLLEPRLRLILASAGRVKPYLLGGYSMRFYDGYETDDLPQVAFPDRSGLVSSGPMAGLGISYDPRHRSSGFIEASGIKFLTPETIDQGEASVSRIPREEDGTGYAISIRAGVTTRF